MRTNRGFSLIELAVVLLIIAVIASLGYAVARSGRANANVRRATAELLIQLANQRSEAITDGVDRVVVLVDRTAGGASCGAVLSSGCAKLFVLGKPTAAWTLTGFDPASPATEAELLDTFTLPEGIHFLMAAQGASPPAPFQSVLTFDPDLVTGSRARLAIRFTGEGDVQPVFPGSSTPKAGVAAVFAADESKAPAAGRRGVLIGFPTGIVRTFGYAE